MKTGSYRKLHGLHLLKYLFHPLLNYGSMSLYHVYDLVMYLILSHLAYKVTVEASNQTS